MISSDRQQWRFFANRPESAAFHMAFDEVLVDRFSRGESLPVFRVYRWRGPAITVGYAQKPGGFLDLEKCARDGVEVTRRLTGGRAVFHVNEIAYAVIGSIADPVFGGTIRETYRSINTVIIEAFRDIGIGALREDEHPEQHVPPAYRKTAPCFAMPTRFELALDGRKAVGSAQRRFRGVFLQQGSIRLGPGAERVAEYLLNRTAGAVFRKEFSKSSADPETGKTIDADRLTGALFQAFGRRIGLKPCETPAFDTLSTDEREDITKLSISRYQSPEWVENHERHADL